MEDDGNLVSQDTISHFVVSNVWNALECSVSLWNHTFLCGRRVFIEFEDWEGRKVRGFLNEKVCVMSIEKRFIV